MQITDAVYGRNEIDEPVLLTIMEAASMQRLQGVLQAGVTALIGVRHPVTRYEHSVGVMLLVRRLGGALEEQIAALLHDISHTAFSHVIDYVFHDHQGQSFHEDHKEEFISNSELPGLLRRFGLDWRAFLDEEAYPLLEQPAPGLCADRLDYFMRDSLSLEILTGRDIQYILDHLVVRDGCIGVDDLQAARQIGRAYIAADHASWANLREVALYELTAHAIRRALVIGVLAEPDLWTTDQQVWEKMQRSADAELRNWLRLISPATRVVQDALAPTFWVSTKLRTIDPAVVVDGSLQPLTRLDGDYLRFVQDYLRGKAGKWPLRVIGPA